MADSPKPTKTPRPSATAMQNKKDAAAMSTTSSLSRSINSGVHKANQKKAQTAALQKEIEAERKNVAVAAVEAEPPVETKIDKLRRETIPLLKHQLKMKQFLLSRRPDVAAIDAELDTTIAAQRDEAEAQREEKRADKEKVVAELDKWLMLQAHALRMERCAQRAREWNALGLPTKTDHSINEYAMYSDKDFRENCLLPKLKARAAMLEELLQLQAYYDKVQEKANAMFAAALEKSTQSPPLSPRRKSAFAEGETPRALLPVAPDTYECTPEGTEETFKGTFQEISDTLRDTQNTGSKMSTAETTVRSSIVVAQNKAVHNVRTVELKAWQLQHAAMAKRRLSKDLTMAVANEKHVMEAHAKAITDKTHPQSPPRAERKSASLTLSQAAAVARAEHADPEADADAEPATA